MISSQTLHILTRYPYCSPTAVHLLAVALLLLAFFATIIHLFHRSDRRNLHLQHEPGTIASAVSIGAQTSIGELLAGRQRAEDISQVLKDRKFRCVLPSPPFFYQLIN